MSCMIIYQGMYKMKRDWLKVSILLCANIGISTLLSACIGNGDLAANIKKDTESKNVFYLVHNTTNTITGYSIAESSGLLSPINIDLSNDYMIPGDLPGDIEMVFNRYLYIPSANSNNVTMYSILNTPNYSKIRFLRPNTVPSGSSPWGLKVETNSRYAYVGNNLGSTVSQYAIDESTGILTPLDPPTVAAGPGTAGIQFNSYTGTSSENVYVASQMTNTIWLYNFDPATGQLTDTGNRYPTGSGPRGIWFDGNNHGYTINYYDGTISMFNAESDGSLTPLSTPSIYVGSNPVSISIKPPYVYVASYTEYKIYMYQIESSGILTPLNPNSIAAGAGARGIATDNFGHLYAINSLENTISMYQINPTSGVLQPLNPAKIATEPFPYTSTIANGPLNQE